MIFGRLLFFVGVGGSLKRAIALERIELELGILSKAEVFAVYKWFIAIHCATDNLATNALTMTKIENCRSSALQAINRFLEAEHIYTEYTDIEIEQRSQIAGKYLLTLSLAYLAEARCYYELNTAPH